MSERETLASDDAFVLDILTRHGWRDALPAERFAELRLRALCVVRGHGRDALRREVTPYALEKLARMGATGPAS